MADIFLSYASSDRAKADVLRRWFEAAGWTVWWDREIPPGSQWADTLGEELTRASVIVVLWGPRSRSSEWVLREAAEARAAQKLVQVRCTGLPLPAGFSDLQWTRFEAWAGEEQHHEAPRLMRAVAEKLGVAAPSSAVMPEVIEEPGAHLHRHETAQLVLWFCAVRVEFYRLNAMGAPIEQTLLDEMAQSYEELRAMLDPTNDESMHEMIAIMMDPLEKLAPQRDG